MLQTISLRGKMILSGVLFLLMISMFINFSAPGQARGGDDISIYIEGVNLIVDVPPYIEDGRTLVPMRAIFEAFGARVSWDDATRTVTAVRGQDKIQLIIDSREAKVGGRTRFLDVAPTIKQGRTMVPLRFVGESLGADVSWDGVERRVTITFPQREGIRLFGTVKTSGGTPVRDIPLELISGNYAGIIKTDSQGSYSLHAYGRERARWWLSPVSDQHVYYRYLIQGASEGSSYELDFILYPADTYLRGSVNNKDGSPLDGRLLVAYHNETGLGSHTISNGSGSFSLPVSAEKGRSWQVELQPGEEAFYQKKTISISKGRDQDLSFQAVTADARIQGQLKDSRGNPLADIYVVGEASEGYGTAFTDAQGNFAIPVASSLADTWMVTAHIPQGLQSKEVKVTGSGNHWVDW